jgi:hypothetical protein
MDRKTRPLEKLKGEGPARRQAGASLYNRLDTPACLWQSGVIDTRPPTASQFRMAIDEFDRANGEDPRRQRVEGRDHPRELVFSRRVTHWLLQLAPDAAEAVQLAARGHTLRRWEIPRTRYPNDTAGYHAWRDATAAHSAEIAETLLRSIGYPDEKIRRVRQLITRELFPHDSDAQRLEDADCLAFLELKLTDYLDRWDEEKLRRILNGTWMKMSGQARTLARQTTLDPRVDPLLERLP